MDGGKTARTSFSEVNVSGYIRASSRRKHRWERREDAHICYGFKIVLDAGLLQLPFPLILALKEPFFRLLHLFLRAGLGSEG